MAEYWFCIHRLGLKPIKESCKGLVRLENCGDLQAKYSRNRWGETGREKRDTEGEDDGRDPRREEHVGIGGCRNGGTESEKGEGRGDPEDAGGRRDSEKIPKGFGEKDRTESEKKEEDWELPARTESGTTTMRDERSRSKRASISATAAPCGSTASPLTRVSGIPESWFSILKAVIREIKNKGRDEDAEEDAEEDAVDGGCRWPGMFGSGVDAFGV
ncbi:hypothetical protein B0H11DRAFT_1928967 [Mycena galericulata]|nr:hypothetical protein B0H11DRAFT_1928967 [Mycena galericulata]